MSSSQRKLWVALNVLPGKWGRLGKLPIPLIGPPARIIDDLLVVVGGAPRGYDLLSRWFGCKP